MPGASELGGFYSNGSINLFIENDQDDLSYEDLSVMSMNYLSSVLYLHTISKEVPAWLESGVGLYFQDCQWYSARKVEIGKQPNRYALREFLDGLNKGEVFDPARLFAAEGNLSNFDRYSAWAVVTFCLDGNPAMKAAFQKAMKGLGEEKAPFEPIISKSKYLKEEVVKYLRSLEVPPILLEVAPYPMF
jgi:hypothetical protein